MKPGRAIGFDHPSLLQLLALIPWIRQAGTVYFLEQAHGSPLELREVRKKLCLRLIRLIHPRVLVKDVPPEVSYRCLWRLNKESLADIDAMEERIRSSGVYRLALEWLKDPNAIRYYKMALATRIPRQRLLLRVAEELSAQHQVLLGIPDGRFGREGPLSFPRKRESSGEFDPRFRSPSTPIEGEDDVFKWALRVANWLRRLFRHALNLLLLMGLPFSFVAVRLNRLTFRRIQRQRYDVKMSVVQGFGNSGDSQDRTRRRADDGGLYGEWFKPGEIVHVFDYWRFTPELKSHFKREMDQRGLAWIDSESYRMDLHFLRRVAWYQWTIFKRLFTDPSSWTEDNDLLEVTLRLAHACLKQELELANVRYSVSFIRNDYSPSHVVATLLAHREGARTVGIQHAGSPYDIPQLAYVHLDHYLVFGEFFERQFQGYWSGLPLERTGRENIDWMVELTRDPLRRQAIRGRLEARYGVRRYRVLVVLPSGFEWCSLGQWGQMYEGLKRLLDLNLDCTVILRFRSAKHPMEHPHLKRFLHLPELDSRFALEQADFTTQELIAVSHVVIANNASFAIQEALVAGALAFTFDFLGTTRFYYPDYGTDFILETAGDLQRLFARLEQGDRSFDCSWDRLYREGCYPADGENRRRIQQVVANAVASTQQGKDPLSRCQTESIERELSAVVG